MLGRLLSCGSAIGISIPIADFAKKPVTIVGISDFPMKILEIVHRKRHFRLTIFSENRNFLAERTTKGGSKIKKKNGGYKLTLEIQEISSWKSGKKDRNTIVMVF